MGQILTSKGTVIDPEKAQAGLAMEAPQWCGRPSEIKRIRQISRETSSVSRRRHGTNPKTDKNGSEMVLAWKVKGQEFGHASSSTPS